MALTVNIEKSGAPETSRTSDLLVRSNDVNLVSYGLSCPYELVQCQVQVHCGEFCSLNVPKF